MIAVAIQQRTEDNGVSGKWSSLGHGFRGRQLYEGQKKGERDGGLHGGAMQGGTTTPFCFASSCGLSPRQDKQHCSGATQSLVLYPQWPPASSGDNGQDATVV